jgi:DNA polymerase-1
MSEHAEYKAQRPPMPDDLEKQIDGIVQWLQASGCASLCREGIEADDWIAAVARQASEQMPVVIASSDKDFMQLVSPRIGLLNPNDKTEKVWTAEDVQTRTGLRPDQIVDWLSLLGDVVDNIPGVPGVGLKTATELMKQFGSVDSLYTRLNEVKSDKLRASLESAAKDVQRNQRLIRLKETQPPIPVEDFAIRKPERDRLRALYTEWGFKTLLAELDKALSAQGELL